MWYGGLTRVLLLALCQRHLKHRYELDNGRHFLLQKQKRPKQKHAYHAVPNIWGHSLLHGVQHVLQQDRGERR